MADDSQPPDANGLPPLAQIPQDSTTIPPEAMGQLEHAAEWAQTFGGNDTNLALRARHNADINAYAQALQSQREAAQANLIQTNKQAQALYLGSRRLDTQEQVAQANIDHADAMAPLNQAAKIAQTNAANAREAATTQSSLLQAQHDQLQANATIGLSKAMTDAMQDFQPGTPGYKDAVIQNLIQFPNASKELQAGLLKNAGIVTSPDDFISGAIDAKQKALAAGYVNPRIGEFHGNPVIIEGAVPKPPDPAADYTKRLSHLESIRAKATDPGVIKYFDNEIVNLKSQQPAQQPAATPAAGTPQPAPDSPQNEMIKQAYKAGPGANDPDGNGFAAYAAQTQGTHFNTPAEYSAAFKAAPSGSVLHYQGKAFKKP